MEGLLARGLAKPLDLNGDEDQTLAVPEAEALWELARLGDTGVGLRFLAEAARDPITIAQLGARAEPAVIVAVGLALDKREQAARLLTKRLGDSALLLGSVLAPIEARTEPAEAAKSLAEALARETNANARSTLASALSVLSARTDWINRGDVVRSLLSRRDINQFDWSRILDDTSPARIHRRAGFASLTIGQAASGQFPLAGLLDAEPFPCALTSQELVELLKMPTCFGKTRQVVLEHLGHRYGRRFVNSWAFVRYAREQGLDLDFTTPPRRPDPDQRFTPP